MNIPIVTGASSGMGREFVRQLNQYVNVDEIWAIARRENALEELKKEVKILLHGLVMQVWQRQQKKAKNNTGLTTQ